MCFAKLQQRRYNREVYNTKWNMLNNMLTSLQKSLREALDTNNRDEAVEHYGWMQKYIGDAYDNVNKYLGDSAKARAELDKVAKLEREIVFAAEAALRAKEWL